MSETERLRAMLDERGVEYETDDAQVSDTEWYYVTKLRDGYSDRWTYEESPDCDLLVSYQYDLGAEEAIAATLGPCSDSCSCTNGERTGERMETCEMEYVSDWMSWHCKSCDQMDMAPRNPKPRYCKWCGRKVVDDG